MSIPVLDLDFQYGPQRNLLLNRLRDALFNVGFLYIKNHHVPPSTISNLIDLLPPLFDLPNESKARISKLNSPCFLGYSGFAEETTLGRKDQREQFDFATDLPVVWQEHESEMEPASGESAKRRHDFTTLYWRLRGPNQWPLEQELPGFRKALTDYHNALASLSYRFVHLIEDALGIPTHTFDTFFMAGTSPQQSGSQEDPTFLPPQHRIKLLKYPISSSEKENQGVGPHKDSSGWLTFLYQVGAEPGLEVLSNDGETWIPAPPVPGTFVVNFGNAFEAATDGNVRATVHRVLAPRDRERYSIPFFMGLPLDLTVSEVRGFIPEGVRAMMRERDGDKAVAKTAVSGFLDSRWDSLGESQLRKWIRSHENVGRRWYGDNVVDYYLT